MRSVSVKNILAGFLIACVAVAAYSHTLSAPFYFDDYVYILTNESIRSLSNFWPPYGTRYAAFLSFAVNYKIGGFTPSGFHIFNIALHLANSLLVWRLGLLIFETLAFSFGAEREDGDNTAFYAAFFAGLLFAAHPIETQAVTYVTQRFTLLAAFFYLLSLTCYAQWRLASAFGKGAPATYVIALASSVVAQFSKEISFTLPFAIIMFDVLFFHFALGSRAKKTAVTPILPFIFVLVFIPLFMLLPGIAGRQAASAEESLRAMQSADMYMLSPYEYLLTQFGVIVTYLRLLILPLWQNLDYDYPLATGIFSARVLVPFIFLFCIFALNIYLCVSSIKKKKPAGMAISFGVFFFFMALSIESSIIPIKDVIFEHRVYLPSAGIFLAFAVASMVFVNFLAGKLPVRQPALFIVFIIAVSAPLFVLTYKRNALWNDKVAFFNDVVGKSPAKVRPRHALGNAYESAGLYDDAIREYEKAVAMARVYEAKNEAISTSGLRMKQDIFSQYGTLYRNLGETYFKAGRFDDAIGALKKSLEYNQESDRAFFYLASAYRMTGFTDDAVKNYEMAVKLKPSLIDAYYYLAVLYREKGLTTDAIEALEKFLILTPEANVDKRTAATALLNEVRKDASLKTKKTLK